MPTDALAQIRRLYDEGQYLEAYRQGEAWGPLERWPGAAGLVMAGRLAANLGSMRLAHLLHRRAWRLDPEDPEACYYMAYCVFSRRGPYAAWQFLRRTTLSKPNDVVRADWLALEATAYAVLRDFENAARSMDAAERVTSAHPWLWVSRAAVYEMEDRYAESLAAARRALAIAPWNRPAVQATARALVHLGQEEEAIRLLQEAAERLQSGAVVSQLAALEEHAERYEDARRSYARLEELWPLAVRDKKVREWLYGRQSDAAYYRGDAAEAARLARLAGHEFYTQFAERLEQPLPERRRVLLPVGFVRQHHRTCTPATLAALCAYWQRPVNQLDISEEICYDGTPGHRERQWLAENGFTVREFCVTWDAAVALVDAGVPFTLTTVDPGNAHSQAVIGYDALRRTLLVRDPSEPHFGEFRAEEMLEHYRATGPRGVAMVPAEKADILEGIELPQSKLYDLIFGLERALERHDRPAAETFCRCLQEIDPEHRLAISARGMLAGYDADVRTMSRCMQHLIRLFPDDVNQLLARVNYARDLEDRGSRLALLKEYCHRKDSHPLLWWQYAQELSADAREADEVAFWLRKLLRRTPAEVRTLGLLADTLWTEGRRDEAFWLYRFAACGDDKEESRAQTFFNAARACGRTEEAMQWLRGRRDRTAGQSSLPARTLCWAWEQLGQPDEALHVLEDILALRPDDGELLLYAADLYARYLRREEADRVLAKARTCTRPAQWRRTAGNLALYRGDLRGGLEHWQAVHEAEPLAPDANHLVAELLGDLEGTEAAVAFLRVSLERFPHSYPLRQMLIEWLRADDPAVQEAAVRELAELHAFDPWAQRELAFVLERQGRIEEADREADLAERMEPTSPAVAFLRSRIALARRNVAAARGALRDAIRKSVDYEAAIHALMELCATGAEREAELCFLHEQLVKQVTAGEGLLRYQEYASKTLPAPSVLANLREAFEARKDLWAAWIALVDQLMEMEQLDEALAQAQQGVERFPLLSRMWLKLAMVHRRRNDVQGEIAALERALALQPSAGDAARELAETYSRLGQWEQAEAVLERALAFDPRDARNHGYLADVLWHRGECGEALAHLETAVRLVPGYNWAWNMLRAWSLEAGGDRALPLARELVETRPNDPNSWITLAEMLDEPDQIEERLAVLDRAAKASPHNAAIHDLRARTLAEHGRFDEALAACHPTVFTDQPPTELRGRAADVEAMRGNLDEAIRRMQAVLEDDPNYFWGWSRLVEWCDQMDRRKDYLKAAQQMARLAPEHAPAWGYLGDARLKLNDRAGAKRDLRRAVQLAPDYVFAVMTLFNLHVEDGELERAAEVAAAAAPRQKDDLRLALAVRLAVAAGEGDKARAALEELCHVELEDGHALSMAVEAMDEAQMGFEAAAVLRKQFDCTPVSPWIARAWVDLQARRGGLADCAARIEQWDERDPCWAHLNERFIEQCVATGRRSLFRRHLRRHRKALDANLRTWAAVAEALLELQAYDKILRWQRDWASREGLEPAMVFPLAISRWERHQVKDAVAVGRWAIGAKPDKTTPYHQLWVATGALLDGDHAAAAPLLAGVAMQDLAAYHDDVARLACETMNLLATAGRPGAETFRKARRRLRGVFRGFRAAGNDKLARWLYHRFQSRLAAAYGHPILAALGRTQAFFAG